MTWIPRLSKISLEGGSTVFMANELKKHALSSVVIAVDTWLGSSEHWTAYNSDLSILNGYPQLYYKFMANIINAGVVDYVLPLPMDSLNAAQIMSSMKVTPQMIHLDGGHDYESVMADLRAWWPLLASGDVLIGDDYFFHDMFPEVKRASTSSFMRLTYRLKPVLLGSVLYANRMSLLTPC